MNRIPDDEELSNLRSLSQQLQSMAKDFDHRIQEGQGRHSVLNQKYQDQVRVVEAILSQLHAQARYLDMLENQKKLVENDLDQLAGLFHPV